MNRLHTVLIVLCLLAYAPASLADDGGAEKSTAAAPAPQSSGNDVELTVGGRLQWDFSIPLTDRPFRGRFGDLSSDFEVRRGRLHVQGTLYERVGYKFELDFAGGEVTAKDMYLSLKGVAVGNRFGHFKEPFGLEELTSSRHITFMERSLTNVLNPSRNTGLMVDGDFADDRGTWAAGVFRDTDGFDATPGDNYNLTGRVTYAPVLDEEAGRLVHVGLSYTHKEIEGAFSASARPGDHLGPKLIAVTVPADAADVVAVEAAANVGSLSLQGEYTSASIASLDGADPRLDGYYVQASYFLTGESRPYEGGKFERVHPASNFPDGSGAWEIAARYARLDLSEAIATPGDTGEMWNLTLGLNWYWNPHLRWLLDYERADLTGVPGDAASSLHARVAFDF